MNHTERAALALELAAMLNARTNDRLCSDSAMMLRYLAQMLEKPVAYIDNSGHPSHRTYVQSVAEKRLYGPLRPLFSAPVDGGEG